MKTSPSNGMCNCDSVGTHFSFFSSRRARKFEEFFIKKRDSRKQINGFKSRMSNWLRLSPLFRRHASWPLYHALSHLSQALRVPLPLLLSPFHLSLSLSVSGLDFWAFVWTVQFFYPPTFFVDLNIAQISWILL